MIYKLGILGASGRVGREVTSLVGQGYFYEADVLELADVIVNRSNLTRIEGVNVRRLGEPSREPVHVWIDFSRPEATLQLLKEIDTPVLIATTGFSDDQLAVIKNYSKKHPVILSANTSPGMNLLQALLKLAPLQESSEYDVSLEETHHRGKVDCPSGTAKMLKKILSEKGFSDVPIAVTRAGGIRGEHKINVTFTDEKVQLTHEVFDRRVFAKGAIDAALFLAKQKAPGMYSMDQVFFKGENPQ